ADVALVFPEPLPAGAEVRLRLSYAGNRVLRELGEGTYVVAARQSWYPNLGTYVDPADFQLTFRVPAGRDVVAVGRKVAERKEGGENVSVWRTDTPVRVAGFNYGRFRRLAREDRESGLTVEVHTNQGTSAAVRSIDEAMRRSREGSRPGFPSGSPGSPGSNSSGDPDELTFTGPELGRVDTSRLAEGAAVDGVNAARIFTTYFGPLPQRHVALTQQEEWTYGQSWPTLVFLPYLAFLSSTQRAQLGLQGAAGFVEEVGFHEISHQWWGHLVGWSSYRDQWMSEGFAEMSAALAVQHTQGWGRYGGFWEARRRQILTRPAGGLAPWEAGPLTLGHRLTTPRTPTGNVLLYAKGAFVLHMLRMMLWDGDAKEPDARFVALMKDYAASFAGREATTADFRRIAERHMVPALDLAGDGTLGWFFRQWVDGTEIPRFRLDLATTPEAGGLRVRGTVRQEEVGPDFRVILPLYLETDDGTTVRFAQVPLTGTTPREVDVLVPTSKKSKGVRANLRHEVLARD
ncbi:MAG TPA: M1 family aminopeptidase, partial [Thermoanaerobaculia bacterium]|nr:M1 family aminopeptidase [Thermoanaerobaculia bacterium]